MTIQATPDEIAALIERLQGRLIINGDEQIHPQRVIIGDEQLQGRLVSNGDEFLTISTE